MSLNQFDTVDLNGDGHIDLNEYQSYFEIRCGDHDASKVSFSTFPICQKKNPKFSTLYQNNIE